MTNCTQCPLIPHGKIRQMLFWESISFHDFLPQLNISMKLEAWLPSSHLPLFPFPLVRQGEKEGTTKQSEEGGMGEWVWYIRSVFSTSSQATPPALEYSSPFCQATLSTGCKHLALLLAFPEIIPNLLFSSSSLSSSTPPTGPPSTSGFYSWCF